MRIKTRRQRAISAGFGHAGVFACAAIELLEPRRLLSGVLAAVLPDRFEPNDTFATASNFGTVSTRIENGLNIHVTLNDDYYRFVPAATGQFTGSISFSNSQGDLDLALYNSAQAQLTVSEGSVDFETVSYPLVAGQTYYLRVYGFEGATNPDYGLTIITAIAADRFEPNDSFAGATNLGNTLPHIENNLTINAPGNDDYYRFTAPSAGQFQAQISFNDALGDLDLILYNSLQAEITRSDGDGNVEAVSFNATNGGTYYFRVQGFASATSPLYVLSVNQAPGTIAGTTYEDRNASGSKDAGEVNLGGRTVYLDANNNGQLDAGETSLVSDANGLYKFLNVTPGSYTVRQIAPAGWIATAPASGSFTVNVNPGQNANGFNFGSFPTTIEDTVGTNDSYYVQLSPTAPKVQIFINSTPDQTPAYTINLSALPSLTIKAGDGNDLLTVDFANGNPIPAGGLFYDGGANSGTPGDSLTVVGAPGLSGTYRPSGAAPGSGTFSIGTSNISFSELEPILAAEFDSLALITPNANDTIEIDSPDAGQNRVGGFSGGVGFEALSFFDVGAFTLDTAANDGPSGNDAIHISGAGMVASGLGTLFVNAGTGANFISIDGGSALLDTNLGVGGGNLNVYAFNAATLNFASSQRLASITLTESARVNLISAASQVLRVNALSMEPATTLDLGSHSLIVQSTADARASVLANLRSLVRSARHKGAWNGSGITSSAAASDGAHITGLATILNDRGDGSVVRSELSGMAVDANCILVKFTYNGDSDLNGTLDADDLARIDAGFATHSATDYFGGDFDYSDITNSDDYFLIDKAFWGQGSPLSAEAAPASSQSLSRRRTVHHHRPRRVQPRVQIERAWLRFSHAQ